MNKETALRIRLVFSMEQRKVLEKHEWCQQRLQKKRERSEEKSLISMGFVWSFQHRFLPRECLNLCSREQYQEERGTKSCRIEGHVFNAWIDLLCFTLGTAIILSTTWFLLRILVSWGQRRNQVSASPLVLQTCCCHSRASISPEPVNSLVFYWETVSVINLAIILK